MSAVCHYQSKLEHPKWHGKLMLHVQGFSPTVTQNVVILQSGFEEFCYQTVIAHFCESLRIVFIFLFSEKFGTECFIAAILHQPYFNVLHGFDELVGYYYIYII